MPRDFVSVVTPTYNRRKFIPILIHLYQQQTYPAEFRELIILDDSPSSNEDLIPKNDKSIRYYYSAERIALGEKRNQLNNLAKGDVIVCFDDDDFHFPERITYSITRMNAEKADIAGCTTLDIYYTDIKKTFQYGPYGRNHGTNGTFTYRKKYLQNHKHDPEKHAQEEPSFTNNFSEKMALLNPDRVILCISHDSNTFDKHRLLGQEKREVSFDIKKRIRDKKYIQFLKDITEEAQPDKLIQEKQLKELAEIEKFHEDRKKAQEVKPFVLTSDPVLIAEPNNNELKSNGIFTNKE